MTILQEKLPRKERWDLRWGSHVPLNASILKTFPITGVLELGAGLNSTPLFFKHAASAISVEADQAWINKLRNEKLITETENHQIIHHEIPEPIICSTRREVIPEQILENAGDFYKTLIDEKLNFLFIDCYSGFRLRALQSIHEHFDVVAYHDAHKGADRNHSYDLFEPSDKFDWYMDETWLTHTGLLVSKELSSYVPELISNMEIESPKYAKKFDTKCKVNLVEKEK